DACGVRVTELPIPPEKILEGLRARDAARATLQPAAEVRA
ncbi:MAG: hypothetical protein H6R40_1647, partial [Gemmatimonadetes bacterium]|nr:hypothetical protein [Gemmatimonadota bacterium]